MLREFLSGSWQCWSNLLGLPAASFFWSVNDFMDRDFVRDMKNYFMVSSIEERLADTDEGDGGM